MSNNSKNSPQEMSKNGLLIKKNDNQKYILVTSWIISIKETSAFKM